MNAPPASRFGFEWPRLAFGFRTALAACLALLLAWLAGLEHPQWSGMTVWAAPMAATGSSNVDQCRYRSVPNDIVLARGWDGDAVVPTNSSSSTR